MMDILILEDEIYLAQKVSSRLQEEGYRPTHLANTKDIDFSIHYDTILLSTNFPNDYCQDVIKKYSSSVIILLVSYVSESTVTNPIKQGADDYVLKPFIMDELLRKIKHYEEFNLVKKENEKLLNYIDFFSEEISIDNIPTKLPFLIETNDQKLANKIVFETAKRLNKHIKSISLEKTTKIEPENFKDDLLYIYDFHHLKKSSKKAILKTCEDFNVILCSFNTEDDIPYEKITLMTSNKISTIDSILTVNDYIKQIALNFQDKYPDTQLSKQLGISRKSLWEKRKKFGIEKKKQSES